jgi:hypothetical protein
MTMILRRSDGLRSSLSSWKNSNFFESIIHLSVLKCD